MIASDSAAVNLRDFFFAIVARAQLFTKQTGKYLCTMQEILYHCFLLNWLCSFLCFCLQEDYIEYPEKFIYTALFTNEGKGRGTIKHKKRFRYDRVDAYDQLQYHPQFEKHIRMSKAMFDQLLYELRTHHATLTTRSKIKSVKFFTMMLF